ncbi:hypothetical protein BC833DRAFT_607353 [Globomyces pollinis-pini]|nr:hypothetical protein BC833DRAFT_607353 [Globomyces pollinis-pini]
MWGGVSVSADISWMTIIEDAEPVDLKKALLSTFQGSVKWPYGPKLRQKRPTALQMAEAGFCFMPMTSSDDHVICPFCEVSLDGWESHDDVVHEHLKRNPSCSFFLLDQSEPMTESTSSSKKPIVKSTGRVAVKVVQEETEIDKFAKKQKTVKKQTEKIMTRKVVESTAGVKKKSQSKSKVVVNSIVSSEDEEEQEGEAAEAEESDDKEQDDEESDEDEAEDVDEEEEDCLIDSNSNIVDIQKLISSTKRQKKQEVIVTEEPKKSTRSRRSPPGKRAIQQDSQFTIELQKTEEKVPKGRNKGKLALLEQSVSETVEKVPSASKISKQKKPPTTVEPPIKKAPVKEATEEVDEEPAPKRVKRGTRPATKSSEQRNLEPAEHQIVKETVNIPKGKKAKSKVTPEVHSVQKPVSRRGRLAIDSESSKSSDPEVIMESQPQQEPELIPHKRTRGGARKVQNVVEDAPLVKKIPVKAKRGRPPGKVAVKKMVEVIVESDINSEDGGIANADLHEHDEETEVEESNNETVIDYPEILKDNKRGNEQGEQQESDVEMGEIDEFHHSNSPIGSLKDRNSLSLQPAKTINENKINQVSSNLTDGNHSDMYESESIASESITSTVNTKNIETIKYIKPDIPTVNYNSLLSSSNFSTFNSILDNSKLTKNDLLDLYNDNKDLTVQDFMSLLAQETTNRLYHVFKQHLDSN